jgi:hypothetical protein
MTIQCWNVMGGVNMSIWCTLSTPEGPRTQNIGAALIESPILELPHYNQMVYAIGQEILRNWRELSHPK